MFFTLVIENEGLYVDIAEKNIGYSKLSRDTRYWKLIESTQGEFDNNKEKICHISIASITLVDFQKTEDISGYKDIPMSSI